MRMKVFKVRGGGSEGCEQGEGRRGGAVRTPGNTNKGTSAPAQLVIRVSVSGLSGISVALTPLCFSLSFSLSLSLLKSSDEVSTRPILEEKNTSAKQCLFFSSPSKLKKTKSLRLVN